MDNKLLTEYVKKAKAGDQQALSEICNMTYGEAGLIARSIIKDKHACEDAIQDVYVKMIVNLPNLKNEERFMPWFKRIVANTCKDAVVKKKPTLFSSIKAEGEYQDDFDQMLVDSKSIEAPFSNEIERRELADKMLRAIKKLPEDQRVCVMMHYYSEMKVDEIAQELGVSRNTVLSRLNYARKKLKKEFGDEREQYKIFGALLFPAIQSVGLLPEAAAVTAGAEFVALVAGIAAGGEVAVTATATTGGLLATILGLTGVQKAVVVLVAVAVIGGAGAGVATIVRHIRDDGSDNIVYTTSAHEKVKIDGVDDEDSSTADEDYEEELGGEEAAKAKSAFRQNPLYLTDKGNVYFSDDYKVYRADGTFSDKKALCDGNALNFVSDGDYVYFITDGQLCKYSGAEDKIVDIKEINAQYVAYSGRTLYAVSTKGKAVYKLNSSLEVVRKASINGNTLKFIDNSLAYYSDGNLRYIDFSSSPTKAKNVGDLTKKGLKMSYSVSDGRVYFPEFKSDENGRLNSKNINTMKRKSVKLKRGYVDSLACGDKVIYTASNGNVYLANINGKSDKKISSKPLAFVSYSAPYALCYNAKSNKSVLVNVNSGDVRSFADGYVGSFAVHSGYAFYTKNGVEHIKEL